MTSELSQHAEVPEDPMDLVKEWYEEVTASGHLNPRAMCFSTSTTDGSVNGRHLLLRRMDPDGIVIVTDARSEKCAELARNPQAAAAFLWLYRRDGKMISRQVRMKGKVTELPLEEARIIYDNEPLFCKIRAHICNQGQPGNWQKIKDHHDRLLDEAKEEKNDLLMPNHFVGYKLTPHLLDFYHSGDEYMIADRIAYVKENGAWSHKRLHA